MRGRILRGTKFGALKERWHPREFSLNSACISHGLSYKQGRECAYNYEM